MTNDNNEMLMGRNTVSLVSANKSIKVLIDEYKVMFSIEMKDEESYHGKFLNKDEALAFALFIIRNT